MLVTSQGRIPRKRLWQRQDYQQLMLVNRHLFVRTLVLLACLAFFTSQGAQQSEVILAANTLIMNLLLLTAFGLDGFAHAAEALVGETVGKKNYSQFKATCLHCAYWSLATASLFSLLFVAFGPLILQLLTSISEVQREAASYLPWLFVLPLVAVWSYLLDGIFIGATRTRAMQNTMLLAAGLVYLPCWYFTLDWGNHGLWFAFLALNTARGLGLGVYFYYYSRNRLWW
jgi:MATE family multidrug resistance protein